MSQLNKIRPPELLAPAGDWDCVKAAVENGADAIYFGLEKFNARMRAKNFTVGDLPELMAFLHRRGVRGYVTFNTLVFSDEVAEAEKFLRSIILAGVDAAIVQDVGVCRMIRRLSPDFPIHSSTQMTISSAAGVEFAKGLGCNLVVLARECALKEIEAIREQTSASGATIPLEVFVHGALCVAYSGQCLTSESLGGRSANRGECAQACRMPYDLFSDGEQVELGDRRYLLSPQDLAGLDVLPALLRSGVSSLKIEGRLKSPEYVASITRVYRRAIDDAVGGSSLGESPRYELEMAFSRGLYTGWFEGIDNQKLVHARFGKKRGVYLGEVENVSNDSVVVRLTTGLRAGDGVVFDNGNPDKGEQGGRVYSVEEVRDRLRRVDDSRKSVEDVTSASISYRLEFRHAAVDFSRIQRGDKIWKTDDPKLNRELRKTYEGEQPKFHRPLDFEVHGHEGSVLTLIARDEIGNVIKIDSDLTLQKAEKRPLDFDALSKQLGRLGDSPFRLGKLDNRLTGEVMLPVSELNRVRREAVSRLNEVRAQTKRWRVIEAGDLSSLDLEPDDTGGRVIAKANRVETELVVLIRKIEQLEPVLDAGVTTVYCEFEFPKQYPEVVERLRKRATQGSNGCAEIFLAPPRIFKPGEEWILEQVRSAGPDGYLARNYDHLKFFAGNRMRGDFSLNVANELTAEYFIRRCGLERVTASYDLNNVQLEALLQAAPPEWFEVTIHQHMPMFHMEHCVFCAFLSAGKDYRDCGRPCEKHDVKLRDRVGMEHPLKADAGCRNTVYNARAQTGAESVEQLRAAGLRRFRIDFVNESPDEVSETVGRYQSLLRGEISGAQLWRELKLQNQLGVTRGQQFTNG